MSIRISVCAFHNYLHRPYVSFLPSHSNHYHHHHHLLPRLPQRYNSILQRFLSHESSNESSSPNHNHIVEPSSSSSSSNNGFFASESTFEAIGIQNSILRERIENYFLSINPTITRSRPSAVQAASFKIIQSGEDVTIGAETGSGKTLAYLLPLIDEILTKKKIHLSVEKKNSKKEMDTSLVQVTLEQEEPSTDYYSYARAMILVPNKELANQVLRMAIPLCGGSSSVIWNGVNNGNHNNNYDYDDTDQDTSIQHHQVPSSSSSSSSSQHTIVRLGILPGNLNTPEDYKPFRMTVQDPSQHPPLDIIITTPASIDRWGLNPKFIDFFADIQTLVIDEADMLLDGGYIRSLENVLLGFKRADRLDSSYGIHKTQYILVAATVPDMGLKSVYSYIQRKFPKATRVTMNGMHNARHYGLQYKTLWFEDEEDEYPIIHRNEDSNNNNNNIKRKRMEKLITLLKQPPSEILSDIEQDIDLTHNNQGLKDEKIMIFLNSVEDVDAVTKALIRANFPAVPYHAKIPLADRALYLDRFRRYIKEGSNKMMVNNYNNKVDSTVPIMVCTDLASRGLDVPGVTAVVQLQFAGNVVAHLHRMGRCGRAGNRNGRGIIFYGKQERELVSVIQEAERQQDRMILQGDVLEFDPPPEHKDVGKVDEAFSRKRGFTKKRKKLEKKVIE